MLVKDLDDFKKEYPLYKIDDNIEYPCDVFDDFIDEQQNKFAKICNNNQQIFSVELFSTNECSLDFIIMLDIKSDKQDINKLKELSTHYDNFDFFTYLKNKEYDCLLSSSGIDYYVLENIKSNKIRFTVNKLLLEIKNMIDWQDYQFIDPIKYK